MNKENIKKILTIENLLYLYLIICPILDISSFIFRNNFNTDISISTFVRPIIPIIAAMYVFFKGNIKKELTVAGVIYCIYAIIHLYLFKKVVTSCAYGNITRELQYIVNYTFMIMNLIIYMYIFIIRKQDMQTKKHNINKLKIVLLITFTIYIGLMYIAILTGTSSHTYMEDNMGYKGWFESGNSIGAIMILLLFIIVPMLLDKSQSKKIKIWALTDIVLTGIYLSTLLGTRVGLFGFALVIFIYILSEVVLNLIHNKKINKKILIAGTLIFVTIAIIVIAFGSITLSRRKLLKSRESTIYDSSLGEESHVTEDILKLVQGIKDHTISKEYMSYPMQKSILDLYNYANAHNIQNTNMREIQLVYNIALIKNQHSIPLILFGNGYMSHFYELIFEMEVPAFLCNFGIVGFILYFIPFLVIAIYGIIVVLRNIKKATIENLMTSIALCFAIIISFLSGYTFFNSSTMMIIIAICVLLSNYIMELKGEKIEKNNIWNN